MSQAVEQFHRSFEAETDLSSSLYRILKLGTSANQVDAAAAGTDDSVGVLQNKPEAGEPAKVQFLGTSKVEAGGAITKGALVTSDASGKGVATTLTGDNVVGIALEATTNGDGDFIEVLLTIGKTVD